MIRNRTKESKLATALRLVLVPSLLLSALLKAEARPGAADFRRLERVVRAELKEKRVPGAAVAVVVGDRVVFAKGFGVASAETREPVTPDTLFRVGSTTKVFTALTLLSLAEEGRLDLARPVGDYAAGLKPALARLTAHQLLSHTAGVIDLDPDYGPHDESALGETVRGWGDDYVFEEPGRVFSYSNEGYDLLGYLIEQAGGEPYARQVRERLLDPLGLKRSAFAPDAAMTYPFSQGHRLTEAGAVEVIRPFPDNVVGWPNGFLCSSANELARFAVALMNGGKVDGRQVIPPAVLAQIFKPRADVPLPGGDRAQYGYGMSLRERRGVRLALHDGGMAGFTCVFRMAPDSRVAVVALGNLTDALLEESWRAAADMLLPSRTPPRKAAPPESVEMTAAEMASYAGRYVNSPQLACVLSVKDGRLYATLTDEESSDTAPVIKTGERTFILTPEGEPPQFPFLLTLGPDGRVEYLYLLAHALKKVSP